MVVRAWRGFGDARLLGFVRFYRAATALGEGVLVHLCVGLGVKK